MVSTFFDDLIYICEHPGISSASVTLPVALAYGTNLFKGPKAKFPDATGPFVSLIRAVGRGAEGTHNSPDAPAYEQPGAQVVCRATDYEVADNMADALYALLWPIQNQFINGTWWRSLNIDAEPFDLPRDEKDRARVVFNLHAIKRVSSLTS